MTGAAGLRGAGAETDMRPPFVGNRRRSIASMTVNWEQLNRDIAERRAFKQLKLKLHPQHLGHDMYFEVSGHPVFELGEFVGYRGLAWDVTERESLIAKITDNEARFRALTELSSDWYWEMDEELRFTRLQRGAARHDQSGRR